MERWAHYTSAPRSLLVLEGNCGPISTWLVLDSLGITVSISQLLKVCDYRPGEPTFLINIAVGLHKIGLRVQFRTDYDPLIQLAERFGYFEAKKLGLRKLPALDTQSLLLYTKPNARLIVAYESGGEGHYSPVEASGKRVRPIYDNLEDLTLADLDAARQMPGICRQSLTVNR